MHTFVPLIDFLHMVPLILGDFISLMQFKTYLTQICLPWRPNVFAMIVCHFPFASIHVSFPRLMWEARGLPKKKQKQKKTSNLPTHTNTQCKFNLKRGMILQLN